MGRNFLLVSDGDTTRLVEMIDNLILSKEDYDLMTAKSLEEAREKGAIQQPDLIFMSASIGRSRDYDACKRLREIKGMQSVPIIVVTTDQIKDESPAESLRRRAGIREDTGFDRGVQRRHLAC